MLSLLALVAALHAPSVDSPPVDSTHCASAARFLRDTQHLVTAIDTDTIDDWRTHQRVAGCRITSAGGTSVSLRVEAPKLYERLRAAGWTRTPVPRDAPNEGALRFRWQRSDCLFNINAEAMLNTDAELRVNDAVVLKAGETRYQVFVMCMPAMAAPDHAR